MFQKNIPLKRYSHYKIGGNATHFFESGDLESVIQAVAKADAEKLPVFILGGGTNLLINDAGYAGLVLKPKFLGIKREGDFLRVGSGTSMEELVHYAAENGLAGLEWAGGLPGEVGGAVRGNAGAFGGEIKDSIHEVFTLDFSKPVANMACHTNKDCNFGYRDSVFKSGSKAGREVILEAVFKLNPGNKYDLQKVVDEKITWRKTRQPLDYPNIGSIFKNVDFKTVPKQWQTNPEFLSKLKTDPFPVIPTAYLIDQAGLKGVSSGGAMISQKHPNFIVNSLHASSDDVKNLINLVKSEVKAKFGITLEEEVIFV